MRRLRLTTLPVFICFILMLSLFVYYACVITEDKLRFTWRQTTDNPTVKVEFEQERDQDIVKILETTQKYTSRPIMMSLINDAFIPFVFSWLCNTRNMDIHKQVLLITTDENTKHRIIALWPDIKVVVITVDQTMKGAQKYSHAGYVRLVIRRTQIVSALLQENYEVFMFEVDYLWTRNIVPFLHSHVGQYDAVLNAVSDRKGVINGGFLYLFPTDSTKKIFLELNKMLNALEKKIMNMKFNSAISEGENDQVYLSKLVSLKFAGFKPKIIPVSQFADGKWYNLPNKSRDMSNVSVISFNWVIGNENKIQRAKRFGHWFIKEDNTCQPDELFLNKIIYNVTSYDTSIKNNQTTT